MKILVTGANGQLGQDIMGLRNKWGLTAKDIFGFDKTKMDITDQTVVQETIVRVCPDVIIHCAAYTAVDLAETNADDAFAVNVIGTRNVAEAAQRIGAKLCYISTDYVFDGRASSPYGEYDNTNPQSVYGKTKCAGEVLVKGLTDRWFIVRTSWVFGKYGKNFVKTMLSKGREGAPLRVVDDQMGSPTYTRDLAQFLLQLVETDKYGVYHGTNQGQCSWYEFAKSIFEEAGIPANLAPCTTSEFPRPAQRPAYSVLGNTAIRTNGFALLPQWRDALREFLKEITDSTVEVER